MQTAATVLGHNVDSFETHWPPENNHIQLKNRLSAFPRSERSACWCLCILTPNKELISASLNQSILHQWSSVPVMQFTHLQYWTVLWRVFILICKQPMSLSQFLVHFTLSPSSYFFILDLQMFSETGKILSHSSSRWPSTILAYQMVCILTYKKKECKCGSCF